MITTVNPEIYEEVLDLYKKIKNKLRVELHSHKDKILSNTLSIENLYGAGFVCYDHKFFHPCLGIQSGEHAKILYKIALLENLEEDIIGPKLSNFIYKRDKHASVRNLKETDLDALSTFKSSIEFDKRNNKHRIRENGTAIGSLIYKNRRTFQNKDLNQLYLIAHQHGPDHLDKDLICHVRNIPLLGRTMTNFETNAEVYILDNQFHHILYLGKKSIHKSNEPSYYFGKAPFTDWPHEVHVEFFGCITLCGDAHDSIHNSNTNFDGIDHWFKRYDKGECASLPYLWISENNYNKFCEWLESNTKYFKKRLAPTYEEFIISQSTDSLDLQKRKNIVSLNHDSSDLSKTGPSEQISIPCTKDAARFEIRDQQEIQPTSLF